MKQCHLLSIFIFVLILNSTFEIDVNLQSINEVMKEIYKSQGLDKEADLIGAEDNMQTESQSKFMMETNKPYLPTPNKVVLSGWFTIRSPAFKNNQRFPEIHTPDGNINIINTPTNNRINPEWRKDNDIPSNIHFFFRLTPGFIYYDFNKKDSSVAGSINIKHIAEMKWIPDKKPCYIIVDGNKDEWTICGGEEKIMSDWFCKILKFSGQLRENKCDPKNYIALNSKFIIKTVTQPLIIIPLPSKHCNVDWNYNKNGADWECNCRDGNEQSPIDLPPPKTAIDTDVKPLFEYEFVDQLMTEDYGPANVHAGEKNTIKFEMNTLRIKHPNLGKIVTLNGAVYIAQEVVFHTPSEHTIDGNRYDMEMQIIHYGKSVGDTIKVAILSFLFKAKPGVFNKFIDKLDFFDLPNPTDTYRELNQTLFIPHVLLNSDEDDLSIVTPFSFFTYQGSVTAPPCNEQTIHYIASNPIELSNTAIELFKEAIRIPDKMDFKGNVISSNSSTQNNRILQPLNGRSIFHYDHTKYNCPDFRKKNANLKTNGHYEKRTRESVNYIFVNGNKPSGMPGTFVVSPQEAQGTGI